MDSTNATTDGRDYGMSKIWDKLPWKQSAKKYRTANDGNIFIREIALKDLSIARATATRHKELLRRCKEIFEMMPDEFLFWDNEEILGELAKELGEEGVA